MFVHAFCIVALGQLLYVSHTKRRVSRLHMECAHRIQDARACRAESTAITRSHGVYMCLVHLQGINTLYHAYTMCPQSYTFLYIPPLHGITYIWVQSVKHGFAQSTNCAAQSRSMLCVKIHGLSAQSEDCANHSVQSTERSMSHYRYS